MILTGYATTKSPEEFIEEDLGLVLNPVQREILKGDEEVRIIATERRAGFTTLAYAYAIYTLASSKDPVAVLVIHRSPDEAMADPADYIQEALLRRKLGPSAFRRVRGGHYGDVYETEFAGLTGRVLSTHVRADLRTCTYGENIALVIAEATSDNIPGLIELSAINSAELWIHQALEKHVTYRNIGVYNLVRDPLTVMTTQGVPDKFYPTLGEID